jgi:hypothetical protein
MKKGIDVSELLEPIPITAGAYVCNIPPDIPYPLLQKLYRARAVVTGSEDADVQAVGTALEVMWELFEEVMKGADPQPPKPVRELFTAPAMMKVIYFLLNEWGESSRNSMNSSPSSTSTTADSQSETFSAVPQSITPL